MENLPMIRSQQTRYTRDSAFSYACHACRRCCYDKIIQLNPYEVARLAANRGISTTDFLARYTERGGTALQRGEHGACVFLSAEGCSVHPDRPLVCRLYPLGRTVTADGEESFREMTPHPETDGEYGEQGSVEAFLTEQGAGPFVEAVDRYVEVVGRMTGVLLDSVRHDRQLTASVQEAVGHLFRGQEDTVPGWLDMDQVVAQSCVRQGIPVPPDVSSKMALHIQSIEEWIQSMQSSTGREP